MKKGDVFFLSSSFSFVFVVLLWFLSLCTSYPLCVSSLGLPIPFSNLGSVIPEMIPIVYDDHYQQLQFLTSFHLMNAFQVNKSLGHHHLHSWFVVS